MLVLSIIGCILLYLLMGFIFIVIFELTDDSVEPEFIPLVLFGWPLILLCSPLIIIMYLGDKLFGEDGIGNEYITIYAKKCKDKIIKLVEYLKQFKIEIRRE